jgi:hypothetical protein
MKTVFDDASRSSLLSRIEAITTDTRPRWGKMSSAQMLSHLVESARMALGEMTPKPKHLPLRYFPLKQLIIYWFPFPKGAPTAPELLPSDHGTVERSKAELPRLLRLIAERHAQTEWPAHPAFGNLNRKAWGALTYKHFDHHLRQFGV